MGGTQSCLDGLRLQEDGAQRFPGALSSAELEPLERAIETHVTGRAGIRLFNMPGLRHLLSAEGEVGRIAAALLPNPCKPVRAILFDKSPQVNWALGWHQDRTIAVSEKIDVPGFANWNRKAGIAHVEPPFDFLANMVTLRIHLDAVSERNAPLLVARGSHRFGRVAEDRLADVVRRCEVTACLAERGDIWAYATPILHASAASAQPARRRVLQVDYSADELPSPLHWLGV